MISQLDNDGNNLYDAPQLTEQSGSIILFQALSFLHEVPPLGASGSRRGHPACLGSTLAPQSWRYSWDRGLGRGGHPQLTSCVTQRDFCPFCLTFFPASAVLPAFRSGLRGVPFLPPFPPCTVRLLPVWFLRGRARYHPRGGLRGPVLPSSPEMTEPSHCRAHKWGVLGAKGTQIKGDGVGQSPGPHCLMCLSLSTPRPLSLSGSPIPLTAGEWLVYERAGRREGRNSLAQNCRDSCRAGTLVPLPHLSCSSSVVGMRKMKEDAPQSQGPDCSDVLPPLPPRHTEGRRGQGWDSLLVGRVPSQGWASWLQSGHIPQSWGSRPSATASSLLECPNPLGMLAPWHHGPQQQDHENSSSGDPL
ncbi:uncharacterized protein LOC101724083 [Heterocephalus glaber]|uniref:Uncharacterized protein LOC101724083 n=1 Tax=Heterocephalus glaber TaxID=10181 RepID=A0AAX6QBD0_HETGA|nr:uncharacterized protein LOC101724083 [Heterocephalus glaber]